jgi:tetratricopeptide (TPR) repeat protein
MTPITGRRFTILTVVLLALGVGAAYAHSLRVGFYFDDTYTIPGNPSIRSLRNIPSFFVDPFALTTIRENEDLRPIVLATLALNYAISGLDPWSYHVLNLLLHLITSILVFVIVRDHLWWPAAACGSSDTARIPAAGAALFFALAPLNSEPLLYTSARSALLATMFYLSAFLAYLSGRPRLTAFLHALALLSKAIAVTLPGAILLYDFFYRDRSRFPTVRAYLRDWGRVVALVAIPVILDVAYILYRGAVLPPWIKRTYHEAFVTPWIWCISQWSALLYYVRLFVWPDALSLDHDFPYAFSFFQPRAWVSLCVILVWIGAALAARQPIVAFATAWFFMTLAPESTFFPLSEVINEHRPYLASSLGLSVLLAWVLERACTPLRARRQAAFAAVCTVLCTAAIVVTRDRVWQWQDPVRIWVDAAEKGPGNGRAWMNAGVELMGRGDLVAARRYFERGRALLPRYPYLYMNLSILEAHDGHLPEALSAAEKAVELNPNLSRAHYYHGRVLAQLGRTADAAAAYQRALAIDPRDADVRAALARLGSDGAPTIDTLMQAGLGALYTRHDPEAAAAQFRQVLDRNPTHYGATYQLATALDAAGKRDAARPLWTKVLEMADGYHDAATANTARERLAQKD